MFSISTKEMLRHPSKTKEVFQRNLEEHKCFLKQRCNAIHRRIRDDQANKSAGWMPWHQEPTKDVISCEKLRGAANKP